MVFIGVCVCVCARARVYVCMYACVRACFEFELLRAADNDVSRVYKVQLGGSTTLCARNEVDAILPIPAREGGWGIVPTVLKEGREVLFQRRTVSRREVFIPFGKSQIPCRKRTAAQHTSNLFYLLPPSN